MTEAKSNLHALVESLQAALTCPGCEYSLQGLVGDVVRCPECGLDIDVARLIANRWTGKWYEAPNLKLGLLPVVWTLIVVVGVFLLWDFTSLPWLVLPAFTAALLVGWTPLIWLFALRVGCLASITHAALGHLAFGGYLLSMVIVIIGSLRVVHTIMMGATRNLTAACAWVVVGVCIYIAARFVERLLARLCIRRYLRDISRPPAAT